MAQPAAQDDPMAALASAFSVIVALSVFPPWTTVIAGNGFPQVCYRWFLSPPPPLGDFPYRIDISRLATRHAIAMASLVFAVGVHKSFSMDKGMARTMKNVSNGAASGDGGIRSCFHARRSRPAVPRQWGTD